MIVDVLATYLHGAVVLGASPLADQYIVVRVKDIDAPKFKRRVGELGGGVASALAGLGLGVANRIPQQALDIGVPIGQRKLRDEFGIDAEVTTQNVPPPGGARPKSEFLPGAIVGAGTIGFAWLATWVISRLLRK